MKKHLFTLSLGLALATTAAIASCPISKEKCPCPNNPDFKNMPQREFKMPDKEAKKRFEAKMNKDRQLMYNALNMTEEQKKKAEALDKKNREEAKKLMDNIKCEKNKLAELKDKKVCICVVVKQKRELRKAKKALKRHFYKSRHEFEAVLTKEQQAKLKILREEKRAEMVKMGCPAHKRHHKHRFMDFDAPHPSPFGCPVDEKPMKK